MGHWRLRLRPPGRWPNGLLGMVVLVALFEVFLDGRMPDLMSEVPHNWWWANWASSRSYAADSPVLALGDSLVKHGIAPRVVESQTGLPMWNLALLGGRPAHSYYLLRHALAAGARPKAILVDADLLHWEPLENPYLWAQVLRPGEAAELAWLGRDADFLATYSCSWLLPSFRCRWEVRSAIMAYWRGSATFVRALAAIKDRNWKTNRGVTIIPSDQTIDPATTVVVDNLPPGQTSPGEWGGKALNITYLDRLLALAAERQIAVFWLMPPRYQMLGRLFDCPQWNGRQRQFIRDRVARYPNLTVLDAADAKYGKTAMFDVAHLNRRGAAALSLAVGQALRDRLARPTPADPRDRWVVLPDFAESSVEWLVEDTVTSAQMVNYAQAQMRLQAEAQAQAQAQAGSTVRR